MRRDDTDRIGTNQGVMITLDEAGVVSKTTLREFNQACLTKVTPLSSNRIKPIRKQNHVSQRVFAIYLNMSIQSIQKWERGEKQPSGAALKPFFLAKEMSLDAIA